MPPSVLILTASIGEGHDLPARVLAIPPSPTVSTEPLPGLGGALPDQRAPGRVESERPEVTPYSRK